MVPLIQLIIVIHRRIYLCIFEVAQLIEVGQIKSVEVRLVIFSPGWTPIQISRNTVEAERKGQYMNGKYYHESVIMIVCLISNTKRQF